MSRPSVQPAIKIVDRAAERGADVVRAFWEVVLGMRAAWTVEMNPNLSWSVRPWWLDFRAG